MLNGATGVIKVAAAQVNPRIADKSTNLTAIESWTRRAADENVQLVVFPECALTGYGYRSLDKAAEQAEPIPGPATERLARIAAETGQHIVFGLIERVGDVIFNAAVLIGPNGVVGIYRKTHLPWEAVDRFVAPGDLQLPVYDTPLGRIGILICYDLRFPEPARVMALAGADIIVQPTNLPPGGEPQPDFMFRARAAENRVWIISADRVGTERGVTFIGRSAIVHPTGRTLAEGSSSAEELVIAEIDVGFARQKDLLFSPGIHELHLFRDRRPELYSSLVDATIRPAVDGDLSGSRSSGSGWDGRVGLK